MDISDVALNYLVQEPLAQKLVFLLNEDGNNIIGSWLSGLERPYDRHVGVAQRGKPFEETYSGLEAEKADDVLRELNKLGILELNAAGWCSAPIKYALKGEWQWGPVIEGFGTVEFKPLPQERKYLHELLQ